MRPRCSFTSCPLISGITSGTSESIRKTDELSITTAPLLRAVGTNFREVSPPALKNAMSTLSNDFYPISTSRFGIGIQEGSMKTPLGRFRIAEKIGDGAAPGTIFKARVALGPDDPLPDTEDFVTSRILWLDGVDEDNANTRDRFIYIHGTKHEDEIGTPASHGCFRIRKDN